MQEQMVLPAREGPLRYTGEVRQGDVISLRDFLASRTGEITRRHDAGADEYRVAQAVGVTAEVNAALLLEALSVRDDLLRRDEESSRRLLETCVRQITVHWAVLVALAERWTDTVGYDAGRWRLPRYGTPEQEGVMAWLGFPWSPR
ncbi:hypothetical protein [Streptomyces nanshensis]|uniref:Uncharacterized protein n=1 Tax=Streptomyces nanshensis TaxID=518642 RepID=A0A1E7L302_9ACTN|nr:hypothetical protein [Streptomyces nanshensis]OEV10562.1 hypothetical protein AN218_17055 [Streptomyces nanshensis]